jgi:hypothetical protein
MLDMKVGKKEKEKEKRIVLYSWATYWNLS